MQNIQKTLATNAIVALVAALAPFVFAPAAAPPASGGPSLWSRGVRTATVAFSPDGKTLVSGCRTALTGDPVDTNLLLWDAKTGRLLERGDKDLTPVRSFAYSPDGHLIATRYLEEVALWDARTLKAKGMLRSPKYPFHLCFSPDGRTLASLLEDGSIALWDVPSRKIRLTLRGWLDSLPARVTFGEHPLAFSPDGRLLVGNCEGDHLRVWNPANGKVVAQLDVPKEAYWAEFSPDGKTLAVANAHGEIEVWDRATWKRTLTLDGHRNAVLRLAFSRDGKTLVSAGIDGCVLTWNTRNWKLRTRSDEAHQAPINSLSLSPDGRTAVTAATDDSVRFWNLATGEEIPPLLHQFGGETTAIAASPDGKRIALTNANGRPALTLYDRVTGKRLGVGRSPALFGPFAVASSPNGEWFVTGGQACFAGDKETTPLGGNQVHLWHGHTAKHLASLRGHTGTVFALRVSPDGRFIASGGTHDPERTPPDPHSKTPSPPPQGEAILWDVKWRSPRVPPVHFPAYVSALGFCPKAETLAIAVQDAEVRLLAVPSLRERAKLSAPKGTVVALDYSSDGKHLLAVHRVEIEGGEERVTVFRWELRTGRRVALFECEKGSHRCWLLGDGRYATWDRRDVEIRDPSGGLVGRVKDTCDPLHLTACGDGKVFAGGGHGGVRFWTIQKARDAKER